MKFDSPGLVEEIIWNMRLADLPRGENRAVLQKHYNGHPPFDPDKAEENSQQINRNFLEGPNLLAQGRRQWNNAMLRTGNYFSVSLDSGPPHKRQEWGHIITRNLNQALKRNRKQTDQVRATGGNVMLHGIGPVCFDNRRDPVPTPIMISSLMIPSETEIDFENLEYYAVFREMTPAMLWELTHGPRVDCGWNMKLVNQKIEEVKNETQKQPNATAYQYMPERIEELVKQDMGFWGSDAVPTVDYWDLYFREAEDGEGWYRRIILDWGVSEYSKDSPPTFRNAFLYNSGSRKYANHLSEILHCNFGDCSAVFPQKYHSVRSLGWMLWGVSDLQNRLRCQFAQSVFEQLMWFFRTADQQEFNRVKKAMFTHMGVIPSGINIVTANDRFKPDAGMVESLLMGHRQLMSENAAGFTHLDEQPDKEETATGVMARVNSINAMVSGFMGLCYEYEKYKYMEQCRRFAISGSPYLMVREARLNCLKEGVPDFILNDSRRWIVEPEKVIGGGNKTLEIAQANQLLAMRKNLGPDAQRRIDHVAIEVFTDDPAMAEQLAPLKEIKKVSATSHDAQLATDRILRGLKFDPPQDKLPEDYVKVWLGDLGTLIQQANQRGGMATPEETTGLANLAAHIHDQLKIMAGNDDEKQKVKEYGDVLGKMSNFIKAFQQRQAKAAQAAARKGNGAGGIDPKDVQKVKGMELVAQAKAANLRESHAQRTAQKQAQFELEQQRRDRESHAGIRRQGVEHALEMGRRQMEAFTETP